MWSKMCSAVQRPSLPVGHSMSFLLACIPLTLSLSPHMCVVSKSVSIPSKRNSTGIVQEPIPVSSVSPANSECVLKGAIRPAKSPSHTKGRTSPSLSNTRISSQSYLPFNAFPPLLPREYHPPNRTHPRCLHALIW